MAAKLDCNTRKVHRFMHCHLKKVALKKNCIQGINCTNQFHDRETILTAAGSTGIAAGVPKTASLGYTVGIILYI